MTTQDDTNHQSPVSVPEGDDALDAEADEWMAECGVKEMVANIVVVFANWASPELLARFREQVEAIMHLSFVEGAMRSRDAALLSAESRALDKAVKAAEANYPRNEPGEYARGRFAAAEAIRSISSPEEG